MSYIAITRSGDYDPNNIDQVETVDNIDQPLSATLEIRPYGEVHPHGTAYSSDTLYAIYAGSDEYVFNYSDGSNWTFSDGGMILDFSDRTGRLTLDGGIYGDVLKGGSAADLLDGKGGADTLVGGRGSDLYFVDDANDKVVEQAKEGNDTVFASVSYSLVGATSIESLVLLGATGDTNATGNDEVNSLTGNEGANVLDGRGGADKMNGGDGNDTYIVDNAGDLVYEDVKQGRDLVMTSINYALTHDVENLTLTGTAAIDATGNELGNVLTGNSAANKLDGGAGADKMVGGDGNDTYFVDYAGDRVIEAVGGGYDVVIASASFTLAARQEVEKLQLDAGAKGVSLKGNEFANTLVGNQQANNLGGGAGNDTYYVYNTTTRVYEKDGGGDDRIVSSVSYALMAGQSIETLQLAASTGTQGLSLTGNELDNTLIGNAGANKMTGGTGDDTYVIDNAGDQVVEKSGEGRDTIQSSISYKLGTDFEALVLTGTADLNGSGNSASNSLTGNSGNNKLDGGAGTDYMRGGAGDDTFYVRDAGDRVYESANQGGSDTAICFVDFTLAPSQFVEVLRAAAGTAAIDLTGNEEANWLYGNSGNNVLRDDTPTLGNEINQDHLIGGAGDDTYYVDVNDSVSEAVGGGNDTVIATRSFHLSPGQEVETLEINPDTVLDATENCFLSGNEFDNTLIGSRSSDFFDGGGGSDKLYGMGGADTYRVLDPRVQIFEVDDGSFNSVNTHVSYTLPAGQSLTALSVEDSTTVNAIDLTGNDFNNRIFGNEGDNVIDGGTGSQELYVGYEGYDTYVVNSGETYQISDLFSTGASHFVLKGAQFNSLAEGALASSAFKDLSQGPEDADDRILLSHTASDGIAASLYFDADGAGGMSPQFLAKLIGNGGVFSLTSDDFSVQSG